MHLRWTSAAADDLERIHSYLVEYHSELAHPTVVRLYEAIRSLKAFPNRGRLVREEGTRELVLPRLPYIVVYRVEEEAIQILHIHHAARKRP
jgi:toxin ParE1/3/4